MKIEYKEVPELLKIFRSYWAGNYHIRFQWMDQTFPINEELSKFVKETVILVQVDDTNKGGQAAEYWTLEYAYTLLKTPKEMELCIKRWQDGFKNVKKKPTLDIEGHKVDESTLN